MTLYRIDDEGDRRFPPKDTSWQARANCIGVDSSLMFPGRGEDITAARAVCRGCSVRAACLHFAMVPPIERWGVWGGLSERERRTLRRSYWAEHGIEADDNLRPMPKHGTSARYSRGCRCAPCTAANTARKRRYA